MALITPPELLETQTYPFQRVRHMLEHMVPQEGVWGAGDYKVTQRAAGANMSVDVAAGSAWVKGDTGTRQGLYHLVNDAVVNLVVPAAHATLPRVDQVIARIFDSSVSGSSDAPTLSVLQGTATSGATLDNRNGAVNPLPNDCIRVADIHVPAADTTISTSEIRDRRPWARGAFCGFPGDGSGTVTSGSATPSPIGHTQRRLECSGVPIRFTFTGCVWSTVAGGFVLLCPMVDGVEVLEAGTGQRHTTISPAASERDVVGAHWIFTPSAGSHVISLGIFVAGGGTGNILNGGNERFSLSYEEIVRPNVQNS